MYGRNFKKRADWKNQSLGKFDRVGGAELQRLRHHQRTCTYARTGAPEDERHNSRNFLRYKKAIFYLKSRMMLLFISDWGLWYSNYCFFNALTECAQYFKLSYNVNLCNNTDIYIYIYILMAHPVPLVGTN